MKGKAGHGPGVEGQLWNPWAAGRRVDARPQPTQGPPCPPGRKNTAVGTRGEPPPHPRLTVGSEAESHPADAKHLGGAAAPQETPSDGLPSGRPHSLTPQPPLLLRPLLRGGGGVQGPHTRGMDPAGSLRQCAWPGRFLSTRPRPRSLRPVPWDGPSAQCGLGTDTDGGHAAQPTG